MAVALLIEEESGTYTGRIRHSHNGYYAGDFSQRSQFGPSCACPPPSRQDLPGAETRSQPAAPSPREL